MDNYLLQKKTSNSVSQSESRYCIVCMKEESDLQAIMKDISSELSFLANIEVEKNDLICKRCQNQLTSACHFKRQCIFSQHKIRSSTSLETNQDLETKTPEKPNEKILRVKMKPSTSKKDLGSQSKKTSDLTDSKKKQVNITTITKKTSRDGSIAKRSSNSHVLTEYKNPTAKKRGENSNTRSKSLDNAANFYNQVCREVFMKMDNVIKKKQKHLTPLTNLLLNELKPQGSKEIAENNLDISSGAGVCSSCGKVFQQLNKHVLTCPCIAKPKSPIKKVCEKCGQALTDLKKHVCKQKIDIDLKYSCNVCGIPFKSSNALWCHKKNVHDSISKRMPSIKRDQLIVKPVSGVLSTTCGSCNKGFPNNNKLKRILATHDKPLSLDCFICNASFRKKNDLAHHMKTEHNNIFTHPEERQDNSPPLIIFQMHNS